MDEHVRLLDLAGDVRRVVDRDLGAARQRFAELVYLLDAHVRREERGLFAVLREAGEFVEHVDELEAEHARLDAAVAALPGGEAWADALAPVLRALAEHIYKEEQGLFPAALATLSGDQWDAVAPWPPPPDPDPQPL